MLGYEAFTILRMVIGIHEDRIPNNPQRHDMTKP